MLECKCFFSPNDYEKNDKIILKYFQWLKRCKNCIALFAVSIENLKNLKYHTSLKNISFFFYLQYVQGWRWNIYIYNIYIYISIYIYIYIYEIVYKYGWRKHQSRI